MQPYSSLCMCISEQEATLVGALTACADAIVTQGASHLDARALTCPNQQSDIVQSQSIINDVVLKQQPGILMFMVHFRVTTNRLSCHA